MEMVRIAVYGTLRKGMPLHYVIAGGNGKFVGFDWIDGFEMYALRYPWAVHGNGKILVEVYDVDEEIFDTIDRIESGAGYDLEEVETKYGKALMWVWNRKVNKRWYKVKCGDFFEWRLNKC